MFDSAGPLPYYPVAFRRSDYLFNPKCACSNVGAWLSLVERSVRDREVGGSNPIAPTIHIDNLRLSALAAVSLVWPICDQNSENALVSAVGRHECIASSSSDPCGPSESLLLEPHIDRYPVGILPTVIFGWC